MKTMYILDCISLSSVSNEVGMFQVQVVERKIQILFSVTYFFECRAVYESVW
jgi:hypothetical protein